MSNVIDRATDTHSQAIADEGALDEVLHHLTRNMKPKARERARAKLESFADKLETWQGCRFPPNVTPMWDRRRPVEQARASEAQRRERAMQAAAIRSLIGRAF